MKINFIDLQSQYKKYKEEIDKELEQLTSNEENMKALQDDLKKKETVLSVSVLS